MIEKEKKYLLKHLPEHVHSTFYKVIKQAYLMLEDGKQLRVRIVDDKEAFICFKIHLNSSHKNEFEYPIPLNDAFELWDSTDIKLIKKRYSFEMWKLHYDLDIYENGLQIIEVEYQDEKDLVNLGKFCGIEITGEKEYSNIWLAKNVLKHKI